MVQAAIYLVLAACVVGIISTFATGLQIDLTNWGSVSQLLNWGFYFIPLSTFIWCFTIVMIVQKADLIWAGMTWLLRRIPGQG